MLFASWCLQQEEPTEGDSSLTPIGLNFQLALFQNQMAQIQMMQAANASAMLNMGSNVGLNSLGTGNICWEEVRQMPEPLKIVN